MTQQKINLKTGSGKDHGLPFEARLALARVYREMMEAGHTVDVFNISMRNRILERLGFRKPPIGYKEKKERQKRYRPGLARRMNGVGLAPKLRKFSQTTTPAA